MQSSHTRQSAGLVMALCRSDQIRFVDLEKFIRSLLYPLRERVGTRHILVIGRPTPAC
jgi:hypothetical protein